jgi:adenylylsulfate kinase
LPCSGKSTLATLVAARLRAAGRKVEVLDGDEVRQRLTRGLGFSREDRDENIRRIAYVAHLLSRNGVVAITAAISPYRAVRDEVRREIGRFVEVYLKCPVEVCMARDVKGLYRRALAGDIPNFTGVSDPYEEPLEPELAVETAAEAPEASAGRIIACLETLGYLPPVAPGPMTSLPIPTYLLERLQARADGARPRPAGAHVVEVLSRVLAGEGEVPALAPEERARIEERLRALGYLD